MNQTTNANFSDLSPSHQATLAETVYSVNFLAGMLISIVERQEIPTFLKDATIPQLLDMVIGFTEAQRQEGKVPPAQTLCKKMDETLANGLAKGKQSAEVVEFVTMSNPNHN